MIETRGLTKVFGDKTAVDGLDLRVEPGEVFGFLGPNGAGKSTTVKMLTGLLEPTAGSARVAGFDVTADPVEVKQRIGYVPESGALFESLSPVEYLEVVASLHHLDPERSSRRARELLDLFGLGEDGNGRMMDFSKGMKQKVLLAAALLHTPEVLFLDEPLNGVDANTAMVFKELLKRLAAQGKTVFFSSHILEVVERICTRIAIICEGRVVVDGTYEEIARATGSSTLEEAFRKATGGSDVGEATAEFLAALERV